MMMQEVSSNDHVDGVDPVQEPSEEQVIEYRGRCWMIIRALDRVSDLCFRRGTTAHYVSTRVFRTVAIVTMIFTAMAVTYFSAVGIGYLIDRDDRPVELFVYRPIMLMAILLPYLGIVYLLGVMIIDCRRTVANRIGDHVV